MKNAGRRGSGQRLSYGSKDPNNKPGKGIDWGEIRRRSEERLDREWDEGVRNLDTIRHRWMKTLTRDQRKQEFERMIKGKWTPLAIGPDGEPHPTQDEPGKARKQPPKDSKHKGHYRPGSGKTGRRASDLHYDVEAVVRMYVEEEKSPQEISEYYHGKPSYPTIINYLKRRGVFDPTRHRTGGRQERGAQRRRKEVCVNGHDLTLPGATRERFKRRPDGTLRPNGRDCLECAKIRTRQNYSWDKDSRNPKNGGSGTARGRAEE